MPLILILILLALIFGGFGLLMEGLAWLLIIALILLVLGGGLGFRAGGPFHRGRRPPP